MTKKMARDTKVARDTMVAREVMMKMMVIMIIKATKVMRRKTKELSSGEGDDDNGKS